MKSKFGRIAMIVASVVWVLGAIGLAFGLGHAALANGQATGTIVLRVLAADSGEIGPIRVFAVPREFDLVTAYTPTIDGAGFYSFTVPVNTEGYELRVNPTYDLGRSFLLGYVYPRPVTVTAGEVQVVTASVPVGGVLTGITVDAVTQLPVSSINATMAVGSYSLANLISNAVPSQTLTVTIEARKITSVTVITDDPYLGVQSVHTISGMKTVLGIVPPGGNVLLLSTNSGATWRTLLMPFAPGDNGPLALTKQKQDEFSFRSLMVSSAMGGSALMRSGDDNRTWFNISPNSHPCEGLTGDPRTFELRFGPMYVSPINPQILFAESWCYRSLPTFESQRLLYISQDYGITWHKQAAINGTWLLSLTEPNRSFQLCRCDESLYTPYTIQESQDYGSTWVSSTTTLPPGFYPYVTVADGGLTHTLYVFGENPVGSTIESVSFSSDDGGLTWTEHALPQGCEYAPIPGVFAEVLVVPGKAGHIMLSCFGVVHRSRDGGKNWQKITPKVKHLFADYANPGRLYAEKYKDLWASDDEGDTWRPVWNVPGAKKQYLPIAVKL